MIRSATAHWVSRLFPILISASPAAAKLHPNDPPGCLTLAEARKVLKEIKPGRLYVYICEICGDGPIRIGRMNRGEIEEGCEQEVVIHAQELAQSERFRTLAVKDGKYFWTGMEEDDEGFDPTRFYFETSPNVFRRVDGLLGIRNAKNKKTFSLPTAFYRQVKGRFDPMDAAQLEIIIKHLGKWGRVKEAGGGGSLVPRISGYRECHEDYRYIEVSGNKEIGFQIRIMDKKGNPETVFRIAQVENLKHNGYRFLGPNSEGVVRWATVMPDLQADYMQNRDTTLNTLARQAPAVIASGFYTWDYPATVGAPIGIGSDHFAPEAKHRTLSPVDGVECKVK